MTCSTTGAGSTRTLVAAISGCLTLALAGGVDGDVVSYGIADGVNHEVGTAVVSGSKLVLTCTPTKSTNADALISLSGNAQVFLTARAEDMLSAYLSTDGTFASNSDAKVPTEKAIQTKITSTLASLPGFSANKNSTNQTSIADNTATKITFTTELYDLGSYYDAANSKWVPPAGIAFIAARVTLATTNLQANATAQLQIYKNGALYANKTVYINTTGSQTIELATQLQVNGTDYFEVFALHDTAAAATWTASGNVVNTEFFGHMVAVS